MTLLAGFKVVLRMLSGQGDVAVGSLFAVRVRAEFEATVGLLANATVLRTSLAGDPTFRELLGRVRAVVLDASDHQTVPIEEVAPAEALRPAWSVWFSMPPAPTDELRLDGARVRPRTPEPVASFVKTPPAWEGDNLAATTWIAGGEVRGHLDYNRRLLDPAAVERLVSAYRSVLGHGLADPELRLSQLPAAAVG
jgi:non-ribosomal peptide synthetase component F